MIITEEQQDDFPIGTRVNVNSRANDTFHDFTGTVIGYGKNYVRVRDMDDDVFDVDYDQISNNSDIE